LALVATLQLLHLTTLRADGLDASANIVVIEAAGPKQPPALGVVLSQDGLVLTTSAAVGARSKVPLNVSAADRRLGRVAYRDNALGLVLLQAGAMGEHHRVRLANSTSARPGDGVEIHGQEGGLPWTAGKARVVSTSIDPWGNPAKGYLVCDGPTGMEAHQGAAVFAADGSLLGVHLGKLQTASAPPGRFAVLGAERLRVFLVEATDGMQVGSLCVRTPWMGARMFVDGQDHGEPGMATGLTTGWHVVRITHPGRGALERLVLAGVEAPECSTVELPAAAAVLLQTPAKNPRVSVDGAPFQPLPTVPLHMGAGVHELVVVAPQWRPFVWRAELVDGQQTTETLAMVRQHGLLSLHSVPSGAVLVLENREAGQTPIQNLELGPGTWSAELRLKHYRVLKLEPITIRDEQELDLGEMRLRPLPATLRLGSGLVHSGDEVLLDGRRVKGNAWRVEAGFHDVEIVRAWHQPGHIKLLVGPDEDRTVAPRPEPLPQYRERVRKLAVAWTTGFAAGILGIASLGLGAAASALGLGTKWAYDRYHVLTNREELRQTYLRSHLLLWGGLVAMGGSALALVAAAAATGTSVWAVAMVPTDPSQDRANRPGP
jgi:hypothetical protein